VYRQIPGVLLEYSCKLVLVCLFSIIPSWQSILTTCNRAVISYYTKQDAIVIRAEVGKRLLVLDPVD
jgi:hypothetical protein